MIGILLAAGLGTRLGDITKHVPKVLVDVGGKSLIRRSLDFMRLVGVDDIVVVTGYCSDKVEKELQDENVNFVHNPDFTSGNIFSFQRGVRAAKRGFLLMHVDHIFSAGVADRVRQHVGDQVISFCDTDRNLTSDDMKVLVEDGRVKAISKQLDDYNHGYVGLTYCPDVHYHAYLDAIEKTILTQGNSAVSEHAMLHVSVHGPGVFIGDVSGLGWCEVDTPEDLEFAHRWVRENMS